MTGRRDLATLPKAHLHLHFTGSMRPGTLLELAAKHGVRLPAALTSGRPPQLHATDEKGWFRFQRLYDVARSCVRDEADVRRLVHEAAQDDAREGSRWLEIQVDPTSYAVHLGGLTPTLEIVLDAAAEASAQTGVGVTVVVAAGPAAIAPEDTSTTSVPRVRPSRAAALPSIFWRLIVKGSG